MWCCAGEGEQLCTLQVVCYCAWPRIALVYLYLHALQKICISGSCFCEHCNARRRRMWGVVRCWDHQWLNLAKNGTQEHDTITALACYGQVHCARQ